MNGNIEEKKWPKVLLTILVIVVALAMIALIIYMVIRASGRRALEVKSANTVPTLVSEEVQTAEQTEKPDTIWKEGWVRYDGRIYEYNTDLITFLFMGIDKRDEEVREVEEGTNGGQADALFLLVLDPDARQTHVIAINRNTMVPVDVYDDTGAYVTTVTAQINTQHGFGNGLEESCEYQLKAVDNLMYNVPIHGYCAVNMKAVATLTDAVGGVELTVLEDVTESRTHKQIFTKGERLHMDGAAAYKYVTVRDTGVKGSANGRLERERQYLNELINVIRQKTKEDITTPVKIFGALSDQMVTNITMSEITYLAGLSADYSFDAGNIRTLEGEYIIAEDNERSDYDEFYVDEEALKKLVIEIFYKEVDTAGEHAE